MNFLQECRLATGNWSPGSFLAGRFVLTTKGAICSLCRRRLSRSQSLTYYRLLPKLKNMKKLCYLVFMFYRIGMISKIAQFSFLLTCRELFLTMVTKAASQIRLMLEKACIPFKVSQMKSSDNTLESR